MVLESGNLKEASDIQLCLTSPTGKVIMNEEITTVATLEDNGIYSCIAYLYGVTKLTVVSLPVIVYGK